MLTQVTLLVVFQLGWFACVLGAGLGYPWLGPTVLPVVLGLNRWLSSDTPWAVRGLFRVALPGILLDTVLGTAGILGFGANPFAPWLCPPWLLALWFMFAAMLLNTLGWLAGRDSLAALLGGIFGPFCFYAGERLGALTLGPTLLVGMAILAVAWALLLPTLFRVAFRRAAGKPSVSSHRASV